jgi:hypothetical protein
MPILGIMASQISGKLWAPEGAYDSLATVTVPSGGLASVTFAGIPSGYKHLQIRGITRSAFAGTQTDLRVRFNGDSGTNYNWHWLWGDGTSAGANAGAASQTYGRIVRNGSPAANSAANVFGAFVTDILDYANTSKNKTIRSINGYNENSTNTNNQQIGLVSSLWQGTSAITQIEITDDSSANIVQYSSFALYGVK